MQYERVTSGHVLLFPEGCVDLNHTAAELLALLPDSRAAIREKVSAKYGAAAAADSDAFLDHAVRSKWVWERGESAAARPTGPDAK